MTEQEKQLIEGLAERIRNAPAPQIDRDAYDLILHTIGTRSDALYILTQTVLIQEMALSQAKAQLDELKRQAASEPAARQGNFLPGQQQPSSRPSSYQDSSYSAPQQAPPPPPSGGGFSGFLHNAATTAAGVIAGEIAFDSLSSIFGHRGGGFFGGGGGGFFGGGMGGISPGSETIVNNYYGDDQGQRGDDSRFADAASQDQNISPDIDDERDNTADNFSGGDSSNDDSNNDDSSSDDSSFDSSDDGGSTDV